MIEMKKLYITFITCLFLTSFVPGMCFTALSADNTHLPDSLITDDYVYDYTFSDFGKAERIMQELRKRKKLPGFKLDVVEGDLYFNTGHYYRALKFYRNALESDSVRLDDNRLMEQIHRMISLYDCLHNETKKAQYVELLMKKAQQCGNKGMQSVAMFNMGKMLYYQGNKDKGYDYMQRAAELMEKTDYKYKYDNLRYNYNTLLTFQELDRRNEEALRTLDALQTVVAGETGSETPMEGLSEKERKAMYAHYAVVLFRLGRVSEAENYYQQFLSAAKGYDRDDYLIMPYLFDRKRYDEVIRMNSAREKTLAAQGDTVTYHMTTIKKSLGRAYEEKGDYHTATRYFKELAVLRDSIKNREQKSAALDLAALYETHEKDLIIQKQESDGHIRDLWLGLTASIAVLLGGTLCFGIYYYRKMQFKNKVLLKNIDELLQYKEELYATKNTCFALQQKARLLDDTPKPLPLQQGELPLEDTGDINAEIDKNAMPLLETDKTAAIDKADDAEPEAEADAELGTEADDKHYGKELYEQMDHLIVSGQLYLDPTFCSEKARKLIGMPRNRFVPFIAQYTGGRFLKYLNKFRLYHAARLLQENSDYSIETVARESGIPALRSFHRLFLDEFGVTPMEYRKKHKHADN